MEKLRGKFVNRREKFFFGLIKKCKITLRKLSEFFISFASTQAGANCKTKPKVKLAERR